MDFTKRIALYTVYDEYWEETDNDTSIVFTAEISGDTLILTNHDTDLTTTLTKGTRSQLADYYEQFVQNGGLSALPKITIFGTPLGWLGKTPGELADILGEPIDSVFWGGAMFCYSGDYWFGFDSGSSDLSKPSGKSCLLWCRLVDILHGDSDYLTKEDLDKAFGQSGEYHDEDYSEYFDGGYLSYDYFGVTVEVSYTPGETFSGVVIIRAMLP
jgi:hypothetical protein